MSFTAYGLCQKLEELMDEANGNVNVVIRHITAHEFGPDDDMEDFIVFFDEGTDKIIIEVVN